MKSILILLSLVISGMSYGQTNQIFSKVKINTDQAGLQHLAELGVCVDHGEHKPGHFFISDFSQEDIQIMKDNNFDVEIVIEDVLAHYQKQTYEESVEKNATCGGTGGGGGGFATPEVPSNFYMNPSYGGFLKYQDMLDALDAMVAQYPNLITVKTGIPFPSGGAAGEMFTGGQTWEGREIYYVKISDNPSNDDLTEPNVLYTAIHHAREPLSMSQLIFYMWYILENYSNSEEIQFLVDNTEMFFVPCINPDGYVHNEVTNPSGGGMHRKNKNPYVGSSNPGVDLNRNYSYGWGTTGVSFNQNNDTYPGAEAFSEPESSAMKYLVETFGFTSAFNAHTYGNDLLHPIGTTNSEFADHHDYFQDVGNHMAQYSGYGVIKSSDLYPASGDSDDYEYKVDIGVGLKDTIFVYTPEIGTDFWPSSSQVIPTCQDMFFHNLVLSHITHKYMTVVDTDPSTVSTMTGNFNHDVQRLGLEDGIVSVSIEPLLNIQSVGAPVDYNLFVRQSSAGAISYNLDPAIQFGDQIIYVLNTEYGLWTHRDTIYKTYGAVTPQIIDYADNTNNWTGSWNTTGATFYSASTSFTDSPGTDYGNNNSKTWEFNQTIDLTNATSAAITYYAKWEIEADYDYAQFQVSTNGGSSWIGQCGSYTVDGNGSPWGSVQPDGEPVYEGTQSSWVLEEISLSDYLGQQINVRFLFESDGGFTMDGFYFDDFTVAYEIDNPVPPSASFSAASDSVCMNSPITFNDESTGNPTSWNWDFGDGVGTSTSQNPTYTYTTPGTYTVTLEVSNAQGTDTSVLTNAVVVVDCTDGIGEGALDGVLLFPNPSEGQFYIKGLATGTHFEIFDAANRLVLSEVINSNDHFVDISASTPGTYYLRAKKDGRNGMIKFVIRK